MKFLFEFAKYKKINHPFYEDELNVYVPLLDFNVDTKNAKKLFWKFENRQKSIWIPNSMIEEIKNPPPYLQKPYHTYVIKKFFYNKTNSLPSENPDSTFFKDLELELKPLLAKYNKQLEEEREKMVVPVIDSIFNAIDNSINIHKVDLNQVRTNKGEFIIFDDEDNTGTWLKINNKLKYLIEIEDSPFIPRVFTNYLSTNFVESTKYPVIAKIAMSIELNDEPDEDLKDKLIEIYYNLTKKIDPDRNRLSVEERKKQYKLDDKIFTIKLILKELKLNIDK